MRRQRATRARIATAAAERVAEYGLAGATVEQIAQAAEVGRATFFRYFSSKEDAVAEGMTTRWLDSITAAIARQPAQLSATDAVVAAFEDLGGGFDAISGQVRELATLTRSSPALSAWTLQIYLRYEAAIAALVAPRLGVQSPRGSATAADRRAGHGVGTHRPRRLAGTRRLAARAGALQPLSALRVESGTSALEQLRTECGPAVPTQRGGRPVCRSAGPSRNRKPVRR